jgi:hypothetical protein
VAVNSNLQAENTLDHIQIFLFSPPMFLLAPLKFQFYPHNFWKTFFIIHIFSEYIFQNILKFSISDSTHILVFQILFSKMLTFLENIFRIFKYFGTQNQKLLLENIFQSDFGKHFPKFFYIWLEPQICGSNLISHQFQSFFTVFLTLISIKTQSKI